MLTGIVRRLVLLVRRRCPLLLAATMILAKLPVVALPVSGDGSTYVLPTVYWLLDGGPSWFMEGGESRGTNGFGHPPFVFHMVSGVMKIAGDSRFVARLIVAGFAALGVFCTARLGLAVFGAPAGWVAGTFLLLSPLYFTQAGLIRLSVPLTALGAATALAALQGNLAAYLAASCALVLTKEPGVCLIAAVLPFVWLRSRRMRTWQRLRRVAPYAVPILLFAVWIGLNQWKWGTIVNRPHIKWAPVHPWWRTKELLLSAGQWPLTLVMVVWLLKQALHGAQGVRLIKAGAVAVTVFLVLSMAPVGIHTNWLEKSVVALLIGSIFLQHLGAADSRIPMVGGCLVAAAAPLFVLDERWPRYLLPTLPFYYVLAGGCLARLFGQLLPFAWGACAVVLVLSWTGPRTPGGDMAYVDLVKNLHEAANYLEQEHGDETIAASCIPARSLSDPRMGYVEAPLRACDTEHILRTVPPPEIGAYLFVLAPGAFEPIPAQTQRLRDELGLLSDRLNQSPQLEKKIKGRHNTALIYRVD